MNSISTILFTGGGSAGHVTPNLALIKKLQQDNYNLLYIGSENGIEKEIISRIQIPYYSITTGKLRRQLTWKNLLTPFQVIKGIWQSYALCKQLKPNVVFSKGGFVAFPVVFGAWLNHIPVVIHESDLTPGLANRLSFPFAKLICVTSPITANYFKNKNKILVTGTPIRDSLFQGNTEQGLKLCSFNSSKPVLLIFGGGLGAEPINKPIRRLLAKLLETFQIIHLCGKGKTDPQLKNTVGYKQFEYLNEELPDVMACADLVLSRAGANSLYELLALKKPHVLIPLSKKASRGDQIDNANYFRQQGLSIVLNEDTLTDEKLFTTIMQTYQNLDNIKQKLNDFSAPNSAQIIVDKLIEIINKI